MAYTSPYWVNNQPPALSPNRLGKLSSVTAYSQIPVGEIIITAGAAPTRGTWLLCDGRAVGSGTALYALGVTTTPNLNGILEYGNAYIKAAL